MNAGPSGLIVWIATLLALVVAAPLAAQEFPALEGRVTDAAGVLSAPQRVGLSQRLETFERASGRQFVVATIPDLQGYDIADYGYQLGREWGIGSEEEDDGILLIVAPNERKVRIEVGYGLEGYMTDSLSSDIVRNTILPRFRDGDLPGGIAAGTEAIIEQLQLPPEEAAARLAAAEARGSQRGDEGGGIPMGLIWVVLIIGFNIWSISGGSRGKGGRRRRRGPVILFGPSFGGGGRSSGGFGGGGFGGFSGGGGSFGGGGASGGW
ncbi:MAG: TPM domain-containing protein [Pacificimonas sp.]|nr:TPM domain-containing protein [Pacificimonas sp.]